MSAIDMNHTEMGRQAVQVVQRLARGDDPPREIIYVPVKGFVARRSTDILAVSSPIVAKAMRFIWDHLNRPLSVDDVALKMNTSRATLEREFRRTLGRGVNGELRRKRLEVCKEMLRTTKTPLAAIAEAIGLTSRRHLHRAFKDSFGTTPQRYRLSHKRKTS
jgi:LacI family transcriptional regulator